MIQLSSTSVEKYTTSEDWKTCLRQSKMTTAQLLHHVELNKHPLASSEAEQLFELRVPPAYLQKIKKGDPNDPLLLQILPQRAEHLRIPGFSDEPLEEYNYSPVKGLLHKYPNRVLLLASSSCAINCRYCFRRNFPYAEHRQSRQDWQAALEYIRQHSQLDEVILSGGDPLILNNHSLLTLLNELDAIPHISRLRIHSRILSSLPERIDQALLNGLAKLKTSLVIVTHCNHPNELGEDLRSMFSALRALNITLLNQSVLLKNINDQPEVLARLSKQLFSLGILPYYLFVLDQVSGAAHFQVPVTVARDLFKALQERLPGYLLPRLSIEIPGKLSKTLINIEDPPSH